MRPQTLQYHDSSNCRDKCTTVINKVNISVGKVAFISIIV